MSVAAIPLGLDINQPSPARIYDYWLGGFHNFEADRQAGERVIAVYPDVRLAVQANRAFLRRAVRYLSEQGIDQFLDLGAGLPTVGALHEVAQRCNPAARVAYVDLDPVAVAHSQAILHDNPRAAAVQGDIRDMRAIVEQPEVRRLIDFNRPVAGLLVAVLHFVLEDADALRITHSLRTILAPGSYLVVAQSTSQGAPLRAGELNTAYNPSARVGRSRNQADFEELLAGLEIVPPGIVHSPLWRPEGSDDILLDQPERSLSLAAIGRTA